MNKYHLSTKTITTKTSWSLLIGFLCGDVAVKARYQSCWQKPTQHIFKGPLILLFNVDRIESNSPITLLALSQLVSE